MRFLVVLACAFVMMGCVRATDKWLEKIQARAAYFDQRKWKTCLYGSGNFDPFAHGQVLIATGGTKPLTCGKLFALPGALSAEE